MPNIDDLIDVTALFVLVALSTTAMAYLMIIAAGLLRLHTFVRIQLTPDRWYLSARTRRKFPHLIHAPRPDARSDRAAMSYAFDRIPRLMLGTAVYAVVYGGAVMLIGLACWPQGTPFLVPRQILPLAITLFAVSPIAPLLLAVAMDQLSTVIDRRSKTFQVGLWLIRRAQNFVQDESSASHRMVAATGTQFLTLIKKVGVPQDDPRLQAIQGCLSDTGRTSNGVRQIPAHVHDLLIDMHNGRFEYGNAHSRLLGSERGFLDGAAKIMQGLAALAAAIGAIASLGRALKIF